jgi:hypothetical protein
MSNFAPFFWFFPFYKYSDSDYIFDVLAFVLIIYNPIFILYNPTLIIYNPTLYKIEP